MSYNRQSAKTSKCRRCKVGVIYTGHNAEHNAKSSDGHVICADCKAEEVIEAIIKGFDNERSVSEAS